jgi:alkylation response protein AidB-like acyl-CoA dehydrogenase
VSPFFFFSGKLVENGEEKAVSFQVPRGTPGAELLMDWDTLGMRATGSYTAVFKDCVVPEMFKQAEIPYGGSPAADPFQAAFICWFEPTVASVYAGIAAAATKTARDAVINKSRLPFGEVKHYPGTQYTMAEMVIAVEAMRAFIRRSAQRLGDPDRRGLDDIALALSTKEFVMDQAVRVVDNAIQVVGGGAFFKRSPLERMYRDVRAGKLHPPSHFDSIEAIGKAAFGIERRPTPRFL